MLTKIKTTWFSTLVVWCDNICVGSLASNVYFHSMTKHIEIDLHNTMWQHIPTQHQIVDILTKPLPMSVCEETRSKLSIVEWLSCDKLADHNAFRC